MTGLGRQRDALARLDTWHERVAIRREIAEPGAGARFLLDTVRWRLGEP